MLAYFEDDLLRLEGMTSTGFSSDAPAFGWKTLENDGASGIIGVELGDAATRAIKVMHIDYNEDGNGRIFQSK